MTIPRLIALLVMAIIVFMSGLLVRHPYAALIMIGVGIIIGAVMCTPATIVARKVFIAFLVALAILWGWYAIGWIDFNSILPPLPKAANQPPQTPAQAPQVKVDIQTQINIQQKPVWEKKILFCPNKWDEKLKGYQLMATLDPGTYVIRATGKILRVFSDLTEEVGPEGRSQVPCYANMLPFPDKPHCSLIGKINGQEIWIGRETIIKTTFRSDISLSMNETQNWTTDGSSPAGNFLKNQGCWEITISKIAD